LSTKCIIRILFTEIPNTNNVFTIYSRMCLFNKESRLILQKSISIEVKNNIYKNGILYIIVSPD
jgi:hypothetical protein